MFAADLARDLVALELGPVGPGEAERAQRWVAQRIDGAPEVTRLGLAAIGALVAAGVRLGTGRAYASLPDERRLRVARALAASHAPLLADFVRAVRALTVSYVYELRHASAP